MGRMHPRSAFNGGCHMDTYTKQMLMSLGRIEGEMKEIRKLNDRVRHLELWLSWLKGGWAALTAAFAYLFKITYAR